MCLVPVHKGHGDIPLSEIRGETVSVVYPASLGLYTYTYPVICITCPWWKVIHKGLVQLYRAQSRNIEQMIWHRCRPNSAAVSRYQDGPVGAYQVKLSLFL